LDALEDFISARVMRSGEPLDPVDPEPDEAQAATSITAASRAILTVIEPGKIPSDLGLCSAQAKPLNVLP
jgi:hypothetical protein